MALRREFDAAVDLITNGAKPGKPPAPPMNVTNDIRLKFYGYFKQASAGPCTSKAPSRMKFVARAKWDAWNKLGKMSKDAAMQGYIQEVEKMNKNWRAWTDVESKAKL